MAEDQDPQVITEELVAAAIAAEGADALGRPRFEVEDERSADWVGNKLATIAAERARRTAAYDDHMSALAAEEKRLLARFGLGMQSYAAQVVATLRDKKSFTLPCGLTLGFRERKGGLVYRDKAARAAALEWARTNCPDAVKVVPASEDLLLTPLTELWRAKGIIPDGAEVDFGGDDFYFKVKG